MSVSDEIKQRIDIIDLISRYTPLKKAGSTYKGLCPFHTERTPSFVVFPHSGTWHCFGSCGTGGDIFSFIMKKENLEFREALEMLAREAGVELEPLDNTGGQRSRATLAEVNDLAATYFQETLRHHPAAQAAREYLQRRGIDQATIERFRLGFALDTWSGLRDHLLAKGYSLDLQLEAGLIKRSEERDSTYDAFRGRLMIPIRDRQGRTIGFGGRVLDGSQPKYLNTAETPLFHKSHVIYGLDMAHQAIRESGRVVIVEGYMDVIAAHQFGFANVVACMGTALTPEQLRQLQRFTDAFVLALDADSAGQQATIRGLNQARQALSRVRKPTILPGGGLRMEERLGANLYIASMPEGQDPDDVIRQAPELWRTLIDGAQPLVDFYFSVVARQVDLSSARGKGIAVAELAPLIAELDDEIERQHYIQQLSRLVQIDEMTITSRVQAAAKTGQVADKPRPAGTSSRFGITRRRAAQERREDTETPELPPWEAESSPVTTKQALSGKMLSTPGVFDSEDYLLTNLLREPYLLVWLANVAPEREIPPPSEDDWQHVENKEIFRALKRFISSDEQWDLELFQETLTPHLHGRLGYLIHAGAQLPLCSIEELRDEMLKVLVRMRIRRLKAETGQIKYLIDEANRQSDRETTRNLGVTNNRNLRELAHLESKWVELSRVLSAQGRPSQGVKIR